MTGSCPPVRERADDAIYRTLDAVGDAWSWLILRDALLLGVTRFEDFHRHSGAARATLTARLQQLVAAGLLQRVEGHGYELTDSGDEFLGCILTAWRWGATWYPARTPDGLSLTHLPCDEELAAVLRCAACAEIISPTDVEWSAHPAICQPSASTVRRRAPRRELLERAGPSPLAKTLAVMGDWWSSLVIREAFYGTRRFDDFESRLGAAPNILSSRLNRLVSDGILNRVPYQDRPPRHEYRLSAKGLDLYHVPLAMQAWGNRWPTAIPPPVTLTHRPCGQALEPRLSCAHCATAVTRATLRPRLQARLPYGVHNTRP